MPSVDKLLPLSHSLGSNISKISKNLLAPAADRLLTGFSTQPHSLRFLVGFLVLLISFRALSSPGLILTHSWLIAFARFYYRFTVVLSPVACILLVLILLFCYECSIGERLGERNILRFLAALSITVNDRSMKETWQALFLQLYHARPSITTVITKEKKSFTWRNVLIHWYGFSSD